MAEIGYTMLRQPCSGTGSFMQTETEFTETGLASEFLAASVPDAQVLSQLEALGQEMASAPGSLPESSVSEFPSPKVEVLFTPHRLSLSAAREAVSASLVETHQQRLAGIRPDRVVEALRPVFLPRWRFKGEISGRWHAEGIENENWEVDCPHCFGSGKVGIGVQQRECPSCWGGGREKQMRKHKHPRQGSSETRSMGSMDNDGTGLRWPVEPGVFSADKPEMQEKQGKLLLLPEEFRAKLRCLRPAGVYPSVALDALKNRLAAALEQQAKSTLSQYSRVESFSFEPLSVRSRSAVAAWLYPAYLAGVSGKQGRHYVLCDALTGKVHWVQDESGTGSDVSESREVLLRSLGAAAAAAVLLGAAFWFFYGRT